MNLRRACAIEKGRMDSKISGEEMRLVLIGKCGRTVGVSSRSDPETEVSHLLCAFRDMQS